MSSPLDELRRSGETAMIHSIVVSLVLMTATQHTVAAHDTGSSSSGLSPTVIGVLIVGIIVVLALAAILWWFMRRRKADKKATAAAADPATAVREDFFMTAFSPPSSSYGKSLDTYSSTGVYVEARANRQGNPRMKAPTPAPYTAYGQKPSKEPMLYNREATTTLRINDSARSYLYEPTTPPNRSAAAKNRPLKIYSSKNSTDFSVAGTNRSNCDFADSTPSAFRDLHDLHDFSSRSNDTEDIYGLGTVSTQVFSIDDNYSERSSRIYMDDSVRSSQRFYVDASARTTAFNEDVETNILSSHELRNIKVEL